MQNMCDGIFSTVDMSDPDATLDINVYGMCHFIFLCVATGCKYGHVFTNIFGCDI